MGFSTVLASGFLLFVLLLVGGSLIYTMLASVIEISDAVEGSAETRALKLNSQMQITYARLEADNITLTFVFSNNGTVKLWDFRKFDLIVVYFELESGERRIARLEYGRDWQVQQVILNGGYVEPYYTGRVLEPSESALAVSTLPSKADPSRPIRLSLTNQFGYTAVYKFVSG